MSSSSSLSSLSFLLVICISLSFFLPISSADSSIPSSYTPHCSSIVPPSTPTASSFLDSLPILITTYINGGDQLDGRLHHTFYYGGRTLRLRILPDCHKTDSPGVYKVDALFSIRLPFFTDYTHDDLTNSTFGGPYYHRRRSRRSIRFSLTGFWSETSRKACLVGSMAYPDYRGGKTLTLSGVLKLYYPSDQNPGIQTSVVSGAFESTDLKTNPAYFDALSFYSFPVLSNYNYSLLSEELAGSKVVQGRPPTTPSLDPGLFCNESISWSLRSISLELEYAPDCKDPHRCSPLGNGSLPTSLYLKPIQCSGDGKKIRYLANFNYSLDLAFQFESVFIAEGAWDDKNDHMLIGACRIMNPIDHFEEPIGECEIRLSLRYPSVLTIREDSGVVGQIWRTGRSSGDDDKAYFRNINFTGNVMDNLASIPAGLSYKYTELKRAVASCPEKKSKKDKIYPDGKSYDMRFDASVWNSKGKRVGWAYVTPLFVGNDMFQGEGTMTFAALAPASIESEATVISESEINASMAPVFNISYTITISSWNTNSTLTPAINISLDRHNQVKISAEGVYHAETGQLCMVGCRKYRNSTDMSMDCEILVQFNFAPMNAKKRDEIKGKIMSMRLKNDSLYFEELTLSAAAFYASMAEESVWRMDLEITLVLVSNTLFCIFVGLQILHVRKNSDSVSSISLVMVLILALGHMIPLVLNVEAIFLENHNKQTVFLGSGGWLEANEVAVRVITMVAFLLQIRLLQLVWNSKWSQGNDKSPWNGEKKASFITLPLYILGALLAFLISQKRKRIPVPYVYRNYSLWGDLRSYAGLLLDGFLFPQIVLNAMRGSTEKALSHPFYIGTSAVRLVPHAYNQYRVHSYPAYMNGTYYYANPAADFYSTAWDVVIPLGVVAMAVAVFLQQRRGGRCILPQRFRELELYAKVPVVDNE